MHNKDAMNIMDFVNQLQVGVHDLEETGRLGYAEGISKIFINQLYQQDTIEQIDKDLILLMIY